MLQCQPPTITSPVVTASNKDTVTITWSDGVPHVDLAEAVESEQIIPIQL